MSYNNDTRIAANKLGETLHGVRLKHGITTGVEVDKVIKIKEQLDERGKVVTPAGNYRAVRYYEQTKRYQFKCNGYLRFIKEDQIAGYMKSENSAKMGISARLRRESTLRQFIKNREACAICDSPVDHIKDSTIDYIVSLDRGGVDTPKNMQLAHIECKEDKDNGYEEN